MRRTVFRALPVRPVLLAACSKPAPPIVIEGSSTLHPITAQAVAQYGGPDQQSGTFDYFTEAIVGRAKASRTDFQADADDAKLAAAVEADELGLGYFGYTYFHDQKDRLRGVAIDDQDDEVGPGPQEPSAINVRRGARHHVPARRRSEGDAAGNARGAEVGRAGQRSADLQVCRRGGGVTPLDGQA